MKCWRRSAKRDSVIKLICCLLLVCLVVTDPVAQEATSHGEPAQEAPTFRSQSNIVLVPTLVRDPAGHAVYGLQAKDFVIEDNGVPQVVHLDDEAETQPVSLIVAVQTGRKARREFPRIRGLNSMLRPILDQPQTQIAIVEFDSQLHLAQDFTEDSWQIEHVLQELDSGDGGAAILDVVQYSARLLNKLPEGRQRVLLLISESRDHGSRWAKIDDVVSLIGNSNITVYTLTFSPGLGDIIDPYRSKNQEEVNAGPDLIAPLLLARAAMRNNTARAIAVQTGGEYETFNTRNSFENHMIDFTNHLHSRYLLSFQPNNPEPGFHRIAVKLAKPGKTSVLARSSYWARGAK